MLRIRDEDLKTIESHGVATFPHECCGILLGRVSGGDKTVEELLPVDNERQESRHNRFLITPEALLRAEREGRARGLDIVGFYHSHPNAPALPSEYDREHAWPTYSYIIVSVVDGVAGPVTSWELSSDRTRFEPENVNGTVEV